MSGSLAGAVAVLALLAGSAPTRCASAAAKGSAAPPSAADAPLARLDSRYAVLVFAHRPDLAVRWALPHRDQRFSPLDEAGIDAHAEELRGLLAVADSIARSAPGGSATRARADTLRAHIQLELDETVPGGALRRDALLWLGIVEAAVNAPFAARPAQGCAGTFHVTLQLRLIPEALRGAAVLMRGVGLPDSAAFESRLARLEALLRRDLPTRTNACKEGRRLAEFAEADTLAAASLAEFRRSLVPGR